MTVSVLSEKQGAKCHDGVASVVSNDKLHMRLLPFLKVKTKFGQYIANRSDQSSF